MGAREKEKMKNGLKLTKDETDRKKGRSWKEGELRRVSMEGLVVAHSRFIINVIVFFLLDNFLQFFQYYHQPFYSIQFLRHLKEFFGVMFKIQAKQSVDDSKILLSYVGAEYTNINKTMV